MPSKVLDEITNPFPNFNSCTDSQTSTVAPLKFGWEWISNFIPYFTVRVITYPCWDLS